MQSSETSFADALVVDQLAQACCQAVHSKQGAGLKKLRHINKEISKTMLAHICSFTLEFDDTKAHNNLEAVDLLKQTRLSYLYVTVVNTKGCSKEGVPEEQVSAWCKQMKNFTTNGMGPDLSKLTTLDFTTRVFDSERKILQVFLPQHSPFALATINLLSYLAPACPSLKILRLSGLTYSDTLQAFGESCPYLTHLELESSSLQIHTLQKLPQLLPHVWSLGFLKGTWCSYEGHQKLLSSVIPALTACTTITHLDIQPDGMIEAAMWAQFPSSLKVLLSCEGPGHVHLNAQKGPPEGVSLPNLEKVFWGCNIESARDLVLAAPNLQHMEWSVVSTSSQHLLPCWDMLCAKVQRGLSGPTTVTLFNNKDSSCSQFLSTAHPMPGVSDVRIAAGYLFAADDVDFLRHLPRVFPDMAELTLREQAIGDESLSKLLSCHLLTKLVVHECKNITREGLIVMATRLPMLVSMNVSQCQNINTITAQRLNRLFEQFELQVRVNEC